MTYTVKYTDNSVTALSVDEEDIDNSLSISIFGRKRLNYGKDMNENILHLLENFACPEDDASTEITAYPDEDIAKAGIFSNPTIGQTWYNSTRKVPYVWNGDKWIPLLLNGEIGANWGAIQHGEQLPLPISPTGYEFQYDECSWIVGPYTIPFATDYTLFETDSVATVTAQYSAVGDPDIENGFATYLIVGIRHNNNLGTNLPNPTITPTPSVTPTTTPLVTPSLTPSVTPTPSSFNVTVAPSSFSNTKTYCDDTSSSSDSSLPVIFSASPSVGATYTWTINGTPVVNGVGTISGITYSWSSGTSRNLSITAWAYGSNTSATIVCTGTETATSVIDTATVSMTGTYTFVADCSATCPNVSTSPAYESVTITSSCSTEVVTDTVTFTLTGGEPSTTYDWDIDNITGDDLIIVPDTLSGSVLTNGSGNATVIIGITGTIPCPSEGNTADYEIDFDFTVTNATFCPDGTVTSGSSRMVVEFPEEFVCPSLDVESTVTGSVSTGCTSDSVPVTSSAATCVLDAGTPSATYTYTWTKISGTTMTILPSSSGNIPVNGSGDATSPFTFSASLSCPSIGSSTEVSAVYRFTLYDPNDVQCSTADVTIELEAVSNITPMEVILYDSLIGGAFTSLESECDIFDHITGTTQDTGYNSPPSGTFGTCAFNTCGTDPLTELGVQVSGGTPPYTVILRNMTISGGNPPAGNSIYVDGNGGYSTFPQAIDIVTRTILTSGGSTQNMGLEVSCDDTIFSRSGTIELYITDSGTQTYTESLDYSVERVDTTPPSTVEFDPEPEDLYAAVCDTNKPNAITLYFHDDGIWEVTHTSNTYCSLIEGNGFEDGRYIPTANGSDYELLFTKTIVFDEGGVFSTNIIEGVYTQITTPSIYFRINTTTETNESLTVDLEITIRKISNPADTQTITTRLYCITTT